MAIKPPIELPGEALEVPVGPAMDGKRRLALSTLFFSFATGLSRIAGLVRELVMANYLGVKGPMSAFTIAFQVPNLVRSLFADAALQAAFIPVFTEQIEGGRKTDAFRVASTLFFLIVMGLGVVTALFILLAPVVIPLFTPGFNGELTDLTVSLSQLLFPIVLLLGVSGLVVGILNSFDHFAVPALTPLFWNLTIIVLLVVLVGQFDGPDKTYALAIGVLAGTVVQLLLPLPWLRRYSFKLVRSFNWRDERVLKVLKLMLPVTLGLGLINFNMLVDSTFATLVSSQGPAAVDKAFRVYMLPQGIFSVAVATVLFPTLSRYAARDDRRGMSATIATGNRQILLFLLPSAAVLLALSEPIIEVLFQRGAFDAAQTAFVAEALFFFALSLPFAGLNLLLTRAFFSLQRPWVPTFIALANLATNAVLDALLYGPVGIGGIPLSTAIVSALTTVALGYYLRRDLGRLEGRRTLTATLRITVASVAMAALSYLVWDALTGQASGLVALAGGLTAGAAIFSIIVVALRVDEAGQIIRLIKRRLAR